MHKHKNSLKCILNISGPTDLNLVERAKQCATVEENFMKWNCIKRMIVFKNKCGVRMFDGNFGRFDFRKLLKLNNKN